MGSTKTAITIGWPSYYDYEGEQGGTPALGAFRLLGLMRLSELRGLKELSTQNGLQITKNIKIIPGGL